MMGEDLISLVSLLAACGAVYFAYLTVREGRQARRESNEMHAEALATQAQLEQALQLDRIAELLREISDLARAEHIDQPPIQSPVMPIRLSRLPSTLVRLKVALHTLATLGGPHLIRASELANNGYAQGDQPMSFLGQATSALEEVADVQRRAVPHVE